MEQQCQTQGNVSVTPGPFRHLAQHLKTKMAAVDKDAEVVNIGEYYEAACEVASQAGKVSSASILSSF